MANTILIKRGNKEDISSLTLQAGELAVALDTQELYVGDADGTVQLVKGGASGSVESAEKLTTARNITLSGEVIGSASFDGSADVTIAAALANNGATAGTYTKVTIDATGRVTAGENITISDLPTLEISNIEGLQSAIDAKADASTITELQTSIAGKADSATTLSGYGITDAYTRTETDSAIAAQVASVYKYRGSVATVDALPSSDQTVGDVYNVEADGMNYAWDGSSWDALGSTIDLSAYLTSETAAATYATITALNAKADSATTLAGYGITDAYTQAEVTSLLSSKANSATTLSGYGITDAYTKTETDGLLAEKLGTSDTIDGGTF